MGKFVFFLLVIVGALALVNEIGIEPSLPFSLPSFGSTGVTEEGRNVVFKQKNVEMRYTSGAVGAIEVSTCTRAPQLDRLEIHDIVVIE